MKKEKTEEEIRKVSAFAKNEKIRGTVPNCEIVHFTGNFENRGGDDVVKNGSNKL